MPDRGFFRALGSLNPKPSTLNPKAFGFAKVRDQLYDVRDVVATYGAFAALRRDGGVVTWGNPEILGSQAFSFCSFFLLGSGV